MSPRRYRRTIVVLPLPLLLLPSLLLLLLELAPSAMMLGTYARARERCDESARVQTLGSCAHSIRAFVPACITRVASAKDDLVASSSGSSVDELKN